MSATMTRPMSAELRSLQRLNRDKNRISPDEMLARLIEIRGVDGALVDIIDGLALVAERDDISQADYAAMTAELDALRI